MKGIAHRGIRRDRHATIPPFGLQIRHRLVPLDNLTILILDLEQPIARNVGQII